jgi:hypothetical protein
MDAKENYHKTSKPPELVSTFPRQAQTEILVSFFVYVSGREAPKPHLHIQMKERNEMAPPDATAEPKWAVFRGKQPIESEVSKLRGPAFGPFDSKRVSVAP